MCTVVRSTLRSANIEIRDIKQYCIGDEPYPVVWVGGQAGWYEVFPHPRYAAMHRYMCQGIGLYYGIMGAYEDLARRPSSKGNRGALTSMNMGNIFFKVSLRSSRLGRVGPHADDRSRVPFGWAMASSRTR